MTLPAIANHLAAHGRNGDSVLVHMTPHEVAGLDALARQRYGHGLPTNPHTGLPEASLLGGFLPAILGIGGAMMGLPPMLTAGLVGGGTMLAGGSLMKGLAAGLGAFGGAGLAEPFMGGAAGAAGSAASSAAAPTIGGQMASAMPAEGGIGAVSGMDMAADTPGALGSASTPEYLSGAEYSPAGDLASGAGSLGASSPGTAPPTTGDFSRADRMMPGGAGTTKPQLGIGDLASKDGWNKYTQAMGGNKEFMKNALMGAAPLMIQQPGAGMKANAADNALLRPYKYDPATQRYTPQPTMPAHDANKMTFYAQGGGVDHFDAGGAAQPKYHYDAATQTFTKAGPPPPAAGVNPFASGVGGSPTAPGMGPQHFNPYSMPDLPGAGGGDGGGGGGDGGMAAGGGIGQPRLLHGPGDGVSDSIPAHIDGQRPAALADGEYVIPARIVSELGNGSTDAGAKRLDEMVKRVQQMRGHTAQGPRSQVAVDSGAYKALPA